MKKFFVFLLVVSCLALVLSGCSNDISFVTKHFETELNQIESVAIDVFDREVNIGVSDDEKIYIDYFDSEKEFLDIKVSDNNVLVVKLAENKDWTDFIGKKPSAENRKISIKIPNDLLNKVSVKTTNEHIKVQNLSVLDSMSFDNNGGDIICERVNVGNAIDLKAKNGDIKGTIIGGWDDFSILCTIKKGDCNLPLNKENGTKSFVANCNNGNIQIDFVK